MRRGFRFSRIRRPLAAFPARPRIGDVLTQQRQALVTAVTLVRVFYAATFYLVIASNESWVRWAENDSLSLLWPVAWIAWTGPMRGTVIVVAVALLGTFLAAVFPTRRAPRVLAALGLLFMGAIWNSLGGTVTNHGWHGWFWVSAIFILLPTGTLPTIAASRRRAARYLRVYWSAQTALLLFYSLSGAFKLAAAALQWWRGEVHSLSPEALARHIAVRLFEAGGESSFYSLAPWLIANPWWGWPLYLAAIYLECGSILVAFRPTIHRPWAAALILMHAGIFFGIQILFSWQILLVGVMLLSSPFAPPRAGLRYGLRSLPVVGDLWVWATIARGTGGGQVRRSAR